jgi:CheY-like chemotaxis protein
MPGVNGLELAQRIKRQYSKNGLQKPTLVMQTVISDPRLRQHCLKNQLVDYFLEKPVLIDDMK